MKYTDITIHKHDHSGREVWHYTGRVLARGETWVQLEAYFNRDDNDAGYVVFCRNDRFVEWFYSDRWYNIFEIHDVADDAIKGWYCNITRPARLLPTDIHNEDLALDVWVNLDGSILLLDEDEFNALPLDSATRQHALDGVAALRRLVEQREKPFDPIPG